MNNLDRQVNAQECFFLRPSISSICRPAFIGFFVLYFLLMQTLPTLAALTDGMNSIMSAGQGKGHSKKGCRCCKPPDCHCDMKKDQTHRPMDFDLVLSTRFGNHTLEDTGFLPEPVRQSYSSNTTRKTHWMFARAPCPLIYLATLNLLC